MGIRRLREEYGGSDRLIIEIGYLVLDRVCRFIHMMDALGLDFEGISVNLSALQIRSEGLVKQLLAILERHLVHPSQLHLEITDRDERADASFSGAWIQNWQTCPCDAH